MQVKILKNRNVIIEKNNVGTMYENAVTTLEFIFPTAYEDFDKKIVFVTKDGVLSDVIDGDTYTIKRSVTRYEKVYCYVSFFNDDDENFRSKEFLLKFYHNDEEEDELTDEETSVIDTLITTLNAQIQAAEDLVENIQSQLESGEIGNGISSIEKTSSDGLVDAYTITYTDGTTSTFTVKNGASLEFTWSGTSLGIKTEEDEEYTYVDLQGEQGEQGEKGETGNGIASIEKTSTDGLVDTYTITYTDGTTTTFTVTNAETYDDTELQAKVATLEESQQTQDETIETLQEQVTTNTTNISNNTTNISELQENVSSNTTAIATNTENIATNLPGKNAGAHNSIYRGNDLTELFYDGTLSEQIAAGTFDDIFVGDYITGQSSGNVYLVANLDYYLHTGDTACETHHITLVPNAVLGSAAMNSTATTEGAYVGSEMYTTNLETYKEIIEADFEDHVLTHRRHLNNAVTNGYPSGGTWYDSDIELMSEVMVYGTKHFGAGTQYSGSSLIIVNNYTIEKSQLALFRHRHELIVAKTVGTTDIDSTKRNNYWLRDVVSSSCFALVDYRGIANYASASYSYGVRPVFSIY